MKGGSPAETALIGAAIYLSPLRDGWPIVVPQYKGLLNFSPRVTKRTVGLWSQFVSKSRTSLASESELVTDFNIAITCPVTRIVSRSPCFLHVSWWFVTKIAVGGAYVVSSFHDTESTVLVLRNPTQNTAIAFCPDPVLKLVCNIALWLCVVFFSPAPCAVAEPRRSRQSVRFVRFLN